MHKFLETILLRKPYLIILFVFIFAGQRCLACPPKLDTDTIPKKDTAQIAQKDIRDVFRGKHKSQINSDTMRPGHINLSLVPAVGYTLQTGFAGIASANLAFLNDSKASTKVSSINTSVTYSQYHQLIVPLYADIWAKDNKWNYITDMRYINYPSNVYGLGGKTDPNKGVTINFAGFKFHQTVLRSLGNNIFVGAGYYFDRFWNIKALDPLTRAENVQLTKELGTKEKSIGYALKFLYDSRENQINPQGGVYYNITFRQNPKSCWGSDSSSQSLLVDVRTYLHFPEKSKNVLAFWNLDWLTPQGKSPYLMLPSNGWDDQYNTGRGYIQGRFRGKTMIYFESEYRYHISRNGLFGGVVFANLESFSSDVSNQFSNSFTGYGLGLRLKLNKKSNTNLAVDYGFGQNNSHGFFVNIGEVF
jgi:hypothetical protein